MLAIIGTYRKQTYVPALLESLEKNATGITELVFVDDSGDSKNASQLAKLGEVIETGGQGYNAAMHAVVARGEAENDHAVFLEEDFVLTDIVDFHRLAAHIDTHPYLAQIVLQRAPWFDAEKEYDSIIEFHQKAKNQKFRDVDGIWEHVAFFSGNPAVWNRTTFESGWPIAQWSEDIKRLSLIRDRKRFGLTKNIVVEHHGVRSGHGY